MTTDISSSCVISQLHDKHGSVKIIPGEVCHSTPNKCFNMMTDNYGEVLDGVAVQVYKKTRTLNHTSGVITTLLLPPKTRVGLNNAYAPGFLNYLRKFDILDHKCRASEAIVLKNEFEGKEIAEAISDYDALFIYQKGGTIIPNFGFYHQGCLNDPIGGYCCNQKYYSPNASGIHFFMREKDAKDYIL
jgi:hypothetical protein